MLFADFGPETFMPLTSTIAAVAGLLLMFGKQTFRFLGLALRRSTDLRGRTSKPGPERSGIGHLARARTEARARRRSPDRDRVAS